MTIYELEKQATPGLTLRLGFETHVSVAKFARAEDEAYWTHCRYGFMRALEALKQEHGELMKVPVPYGEAGDRFMESRDAIAELVQELEAIET